MIQTFHIHPIQAPHLLKGMYTCPPPLPEDVIHGMVLIPDLTVPLNMVTRTQLIHGGMHTENMLHQVLLMPDYM